MGRRDGERAIAALPIEIFIAVTLFFDPLRRFLFGGFEQFTDGDRSREFARNMNMVRNAPDSVRLGVTITANRRQICVHPLADFVVEKRLSILGAKHDVQDDAA